MNARFPDNWCWTEGCVILCTVIPVPYKPKNPAFARTPLAIEYTVDAPFVSVRCVKAVQRQHPSFS